MRILALLLTLLALSLPAHAQQTTRGCLQSGTTQCVPFGSSQAQTKNGSVAITTGLTYQLLLAASTSRNSLTIENNQASGTDVCYLLFGSNVTVVAGTTTTSSTSIISGSASITAANASIVLSVGQAYTRYYPFVPSEAIYVTCTTTGDLIYADTQ
jgi:hypothetical protein